MVRDPFLKVEETALIFFLILSSHVLVFVFHVLILYQQSLGPPTASMIRSLLVVYTHSCKLFWGSGFFV